MSPLGPDQCPVVTRDADGALTLDWPYGKGRPFLVTPEVLEGVVAEHNALLAQVVDAQNACDRMEAVAGDFALRWKHACERADAAEMRERSR